MVLIDGGLICPDVKQKHCFRIIHRKEAFVFDVASLSIDLINNLALSHSLDKCPCVAVPAREKDVDCDCHIHTPSVQVFQFAFTCYPKSPVL